MTHRQERFIHEYMVDRNGQAAARRAGYKEGYASKLLGVPQIRQAIAERTQQEAAQCSLRREQVLEGLCQVAFAEASDATGSEVKVAGKLKALELLGRHLGLFEGRGERIEPATVVEDV